MTKLFDDISAQSGELSQVLDRFLAADCSIQPAASMLRRSAQIYITGIGASWNAAIAVQSIFDSYGRSVRVVDASDLVEFVPITRNTTLLVLSRSGKSIEIIRLLDKAKAVGAKLISITTQDDNPLASGADIPIFTKTSFDHSISIKTYSALILIGGILAHEADGGGDQGLYDELRSALNMVAPASLEWMRKISGSEWFGASFPVYFLGRGGSVASAHGARLLWEEVAKCPATAMGTGVFRHGPIEMIDPSLRVAIWLDPGRQRENDLILVDDLRGLQVKVMLVGQGIAEDAADLVLEVPPSPAVWQPLFDIMPLQYASEYLARIRDVDCDKFLFCSPICESEGGFIKSNN